MKDRKIKLNKIPVVMFLKTYEGNAKDELYIELRKNLNDILALENYEAVFTISNTEFEDDIKIQLLSDYIDGLFIKK